MMMQPNLGSSGADTAAQDNDVRAVRDTLLQLRKRWAMGGDRDRSVDLGALLGLVIVRRVAHLTGRDPKAALPEALRYIAGTLEPADRLIVDAELNLSMLAAQLPTSIADELYGPELGQRRDSLALHWMTLHEHLGVPVAQVPRNNRALRGRREEDAFTALARGLTLESVAADGLPGATTRPSAVVIGDAAWDRICTVDVLPQAGDSLYGEFSEHAGGKGLNRAVALARLGVDARLFAAVGDDDKAGLIVDYLRARGVDTSLLRARRGPTPTAAVTVARDGGNYSVAGKDDRIRFDARDIADIPITRALVHADAVLLTFEQNVEVLAAVADAIADRESRPWLFVSATPPPKRFPAQLPGYLRTVDYLIASVGELAALRPGAESADIAAQLVKHGVGSVVVLHGDSCAMYSAGDPAAEPVWADIQTDRPGAPGASSAFASAFIARLMTQPRPADPARRRQAGHANLVWAAAAIPARASKETSIPDSMPTREAIDATLDAF
ncbi:carbohydrate kinase family protein [Nocardia sp. NPDC059764]|uniref:carbohydrate kinase family protein n=1 Tax=Nocardia sp. NPDC059764 TaxID=3346939 RepID=UPI0036690168